MVESDLSNDPSLGNHRIPATPDLSRRLYTLHEDQPTAESEADIACANDSFHTTIARILHQVLPSISLEDTDKAIKDFISPLGIENESGLSSIEDTDELPAITTSGPWSNKIFRKSFLVICEASINYRLLSSTNFQLLNRYVKQGSTTTPGTPSSITVTSTSSTTKEEKYKLDACAKVELKTFSGLSIDYKQWDEHVRLSYGVCGMSSFLTDSSLCSQHKEISSSIKFNLCKALKEGHFAYLVDDYKTEMNAAIFYAIVKKEADETSDQRIREFKAWWHLFTHTLDSPKSYNSFINKYNISITTLKEAKSKGVDDEILIRALLLRAIQCEEYEDVKKVVTKNLNIKPKDILTELKNHHLALESEERLNDVSTSSSKSKTKTVRRGASKGNESDTSSKNGDSKWRTPFIPRWPNGLSEVCTTKLWSQLNDWKSLVNKTNKNNNERQRLKDFKINSSNSQSDNDSRNRKRDRDRGYSSDRRGKDDYKNGRSSKSNRYTSDRRRSSRRSGIRSRSRSPNSESDVDSVSSFHSDASKSNPKKKIRRSRKREEEGSPSPERDRSSRKILGGILKRH